MSDEEKPSLSPAEEEAFLATARRRFQQYAADEKDIREEALKDLRFVAGDQWDPALKAARTQQGMPALTFNRMHTFEQRVANEARQNKPQIKFVAADGGDPDTAEVFEGLARHIQYDSDAQVAYETAVEYAAGGSFGYFRFLTDYCDEETNNLDLRVVPVLDPFAVYGVLIPACFGIQPRAWFIVESLSKEEFRAEYPDSPLSEPGFVDDGRYGDWVGDRIRVAEYWWVTEETKTNAAGRKAKRKTIHSCKMTAAEILPDTTTVWPGTRCNVIPVLGKQKIVDGKPRLFSVVRFQRDPQHLINAYKSRVAATLAVNPISPWIAAAGQIPSEPHLRRAWMEAATRASVLEYSAVDVMGKLSPPPARQVYEPPITAYSEAAAAEIDDMKATAGIYDASLGSRSNENSGLAIQRRQQQSDVTNLHFMDNLERAFKQGGLVMEEVMPKVYDAARAVRILGEDEAPKIVKINQSFNDNGKSKHYKLGGEGAGKYQVLVTMGKAYASKRMESYDFMVQLVQASPNELPFIGDILFANADVAGARELAERYKKRLPPELQDGDGADPKAMLGQLQAKLGQMGQQLQAVDAFAAQLQKEKEGRVLENQTKLQIEQMKSDLELKRLEVQVTIAEINTKAQNERERMKLEFDLNAKLHVSAHEHAQQKDQQAHEIGMAERGHEQALEQQDQAGEQALTQQQMAAEAQPSEA